MAIRARPGQFLLSPKPAPGRRGSRVRSATAKRDRLPLSRARQMGGAAVRSTPLTTSNAPSQKMISILASRLPGESRPLAPSLPTMYHYHQAAAMASSTSHRGRACLPGSYPFESLDAIRRSLYAPSFRCHRARRVALPHAAHRPLESVSPGGSSTAVVTTLSTTSAERWDAASSSQRPDRSETRPSTSSSMKPLSPLTHGPLGLADPSHDRHRARLRSV